MYETIKRVELPEGMSVHMMKFSDIDYRVKLVDDDAEQVVDGSLTICKTLAAAELRFAKLVTG